MRSDLGGGGMKSENPVMFSHLLIMNFDLTLFFMHCGEQIGPRLESGHRMVITLSVWRSVCLSILPYICFMMITLVHIDQLYSYGTYVSLLKQ